MIQLRAHNRLVDRPLERIAILCHRVDLDIPLEAWVEVSMSLGPIKPEEHTSGPEGTIEQMIVDVGDCVRRVVVVDQPLPSNKGPFFGIQTDVHRVRDTLLPCVRRKRKSEDNEEWE